MQIGEGLCVHSAPGRGAQELGRIYPLEQTSCLTSDSLLVWASRSDVRSRGSCFCLVLELKVQEVFRNEVTGGTCRIFFSVSVETYSEQGSNAWWDL